jgi:hypothetical protein
MAERNPCCAPACIIPQVTGDVHIVSTRPRHTRASPIVDTGPGPAAAYGAKGSRRADHGSAPELPMLSQAQQQPSQQQQRDRRTSHAGGGGGGFALQARQARVSQSNGVVAAGAAAGMADSGVRLPR